MTGIMRPTRSRNEVGEFIRKAFGPSSGKGMTLEDHLESLDEKTLKHLMQTAHFVKLAMAWQVQPITYYDLAKQMYPNIGHYKLRMIGEMLQQADPITIQAEPQREGAGSHAEAATDIYEDFVRRSTPAADLPSEASTEALVGKADTSSDFVHKLMISESSGKADAEIVLKDGRRFVGKYQFGPLRLADYKQATGESFTQDQFKRDAELQDKVANWHFADLSKAIDDLGDAAKGYDREGLLAVGHLSGAAGMKRFVKTRGAYNPSDALGTSLSDYYSKFSSKQS